MTPPSTPACRTSHRVAALVAAVLMSVPAWGGQRDDGAPRESSDRRPSVSLKATPPVGFTPLRVRLSVELRGGADDFADFYCPTVEWTWGDGTTSENTEDCEPYEEGKSQIRRRLGVDHVYREPGGYRVQFRLKQKSRVVAQSSAIIQVRAGAGSE